MRSLAKPAGAGPLRRGRIPLRTRALAVAAVYAAFATGWIYFSDHALSLFIADPNELVRWSVYKGLVFVGITSGVLLLVLRRAYGAMEEGYGLLKARQVEIERINRLNVALGQINQASMRLAVRDELCAQVCRVLVDQGGFRLAWVGWENLAPRRLEIVATAGDDGDPLDRVAAWVEVAPAMRALREGRPCACNRLSDEPAGRAWRKEARRRGSRAALALPVRTGGRVAGVLCVHAAEENYFREKEVALLAEAAADVGFALDYHAQEAERRSAETRAQSERRFSDTMIESMPGILYFYDRTGRFLRWNRNFERVSGYTGEEIARMHPLDFFAPEDREAVSAGIGQAFEGGEASVEAPFRAKDGGLTPYFFTGRRVDFEGRVCLVGVGIDVAERHRAEEALRSAKETLEQKVTERTGELQAALVRAEAADRIKSAFLATMSHELRTPLNSIIGFTGIVLQGLAGPLNDEQTRQLGMVRGSARHLLELINDVLDISKIEAGQLEVRAEPFDVAEAIARVTASVQPLAEKKGLQLVTQVDPALHGMKGDRRRVEQILLNLLNNAIKFTERGSVTLTAERLAAHRFAPDAAAVAAVRLRVKDTGIGIKAEDLATLFQPFRQVDTGLARLHEGTGLGLAICRRLAMLMGGDISAASEWSLGSEFAVVLPLHRSPSP